MGHIQDRWYSRKIDPSTGKASRVRTSLYGKGNRYKVRYLDPDGNERSESFPDKCRGQAEDFLHRVENELRRGSYVDPDAGRILLADYAERWVQAQTFDELTRETTESRLRSKIVPFFRGKELSAIRPTDIRGWLRWMQQEKAASSYQAVCFAHLSAIFTAAVDDKLIVSNPCHVRSVTRPKPGERKITPWPRSTVKKVHLALPERFKITVPLGAGCGRARFLGSASTRSTVTAWSSTLFGNSARSEGSSCSPCPNGARPGTCRCRVGCSGSSTTTWSGSHRSASPCRGATRAETR